MRTDSPPNQSSDPVELDKNYWETQWHNKKTGWDIGYSSPAIEEYMRQYQNKDAKILIPGCGNAYEVAFLWNLGFKNLTVLDIASEAVQILKEKYKEKVGVSILCEDFFTHAEKYDLIIEQTFFCSLSPILRPKYAEKMHELLNENGRIIGLVFNRSFEKNGPPFGGNMQEYQSIFEKYFEIKKMEECYNSIQPRKGSEVFINLKKMK